VEQWDYFEKATDEKPKMSTPWTDWKRHGGIMLSASRGQRSHGDVAVLEALPAPFTAALTSPEAVDWVQLVAAGS
jgi:hypothetical protein